MSLLPRARSLRRQWAIRAGQIATPAGPLPTVMGADTAPVAVVITDTVPSHVVGHVGVLAVRSDRHLVRTVADGDGGRHRTRRGRDHRHRAIDAVGHVGVLAVRSDRHPERILADGDGGRHRTRRGRDHRHRAIEIVGHVGVLAVRGERHPDRNLADGDGGRHRTRRRRDHRHRAIADRRPRRRACRQE